MADKYTNSKIKRISGAKVSVSGQRILPAYQLVLRYAADNPDYVERPAQGEEDTRTSRQKRAHVWREVTKVVHVKDDKAAYAELEKWHAEMEEEEHKANEEQQGKEPSKGLLLVPQYVRYYVDSRAGGSEGIQVSTRENYGYAMRYLDREELRVPMCELSAEDVEAWRDATASEGIGSSIRARAFSLLKYAVDFALDMGHRDGGNPCRAIKAPTARRRGANPLNEENIEQLNYILKRLLERRPDRRDFVDAVKLALLTAMRQGEVTALRWSNVDGWRTGKFEPRKGRIHVNYALANAGSGNGGYYLKPFPKNKNRRRIPINEDLAAFLRSRWEYSNELCLSAGVPFSGDMFVLGKPAAKDEGFFSPNYLGKQWKAFVDNTDLVGEEGLVPHFHDLRHTAAVHMLRSGVDVQTVAGVLGHQNAGTTLTFYSRFLDADLVEAMQGMDGKLTAEARHADVIQFKPTGTEGR